MRPAKSKIELNPILIRYLLTIETGQEEREDVNIKIEPKEWVVVNTIDKDESYSEKHEQLFDKFKQYFINKKILDFPRLDNYIKKYYPKMNDDIRYSSFTTTNPYKHVIYENMFLVKVIDLKRLKKFNNQFCYRKIPKETNISIKEKRIVDFDKKTKTLSKYGLKTHDFMKGKHREKNTLKIFSELWERRRHIIKNNARLSKQGDPDSLTNFVRKLGLVKTTQVLGDRTKVISLKEQIRTVIRNLQRDGYPMKLTCKYDRVLLTIEE